VFAGHNNGTAGDDSETDQEQMSARNWCLHR